MYDLLIVGGGMVGASLARALDGCGLHIGVIEAALRTAAVQPSYDERVIALSLGSQRILQGMGVWGAMAEASAPIRHIHISDRGHFGFAHLDAADEGVPALGYVTPARVIGQALLAGNDRQGDLDWHCPARLLGLTPGDDRVRVRIDRAGESAELETRLLVAADGGDSTVRQMLGLGTRDWDYAQTAIIANVRSHISPGERAYERFTDTGPLALLPLADGRCALVWTTRHDQVEGILGLEDTAFLAALQERFGYRLGRFLEAGRRSAYPLRLRRLSPAVHGRVVFIGNAAHSIHPVGGQGYNLGLRDVAVLAEGLARAARQGGDAGDPGLLRAYEARRAPDQRRIALITDLLARGFANPLPPLRWARDLGLLALDLAPPAKHRVNRQFMGLLGPLPRLARGLHLGRDCRPDEADARTRPNPSLQEANEQTP